MRFVGVCYRAHDPQWAWSPLSGEGASLKGGRFNAKGTPALYLALSLEGMFLEMGHGFARRFSPLTVCSYNIDMKDVVDLRDESGRTAAGVTFEDLACPWALEVAAGREPQSWALSKAFIASGAAGALVPSFANGARPEMANLVLWRWGDTPPHIVRVHDPDGRLPKDQSSWME